MRVHSTRWPQMLWQAKNKKYFNTSPEKFPGEAEMEKQIHPKKYEYAILQEHACTHTHTHTHPRMCTIHTHTLFCAHTHTHTHPPTHTISMIIRSVTRHCDGINLHLLMKWLMGGWMHALVQWFHWQLDWFINRLFSFADRLSLTADQLCEWLMLTLTLSWLPHQPCCRRWERQSQSQTSHSLLIWPEMSPLHTIASPKYEVFLYYLYIYTISYYYNNGNLYK